jgi:copper resistance protein B
MRLNLLLAGAVLVATVPAKSQPMDHSHHQMTEQPADPHAGHDMSATPKADEADPHAGHDMGAAEQPVGNAPAPPAPTDHAADRFYAAPEMAEARAQLRREHGGTTASQIIFDLAEYQIRDGHDGYRWEAEGWFGGDINRVVAKSEGEGGIDEGLESAELQLLYSRALDPYWNLQAGIRHDIKPNPSRTYATIGFEGVAPYWFELEGALFLSDTGDLLARIEGMYDQRVTQRLILQPRAELNFAAQDVPRQGVGSGLVDAELGLRLRYEIAREFAPYVGVSYETKVGDTRRIARTAGEDPESTSLVIGVRAWF